MRYFPPPLENRTDATPKVTLWVRHHTISGFHAAPHSLPCFPECQPETGTAVQLFFFNLLVRQLISLYCASVSWLLHKIPSVSLLIQLGGCAQRTPRPAPRTGTLLPRGLLGLPWSHRTWLRCMSRPAPSNSSPDLKHFCWDLKHYLPLDTKWRPFFGTSNTHRYLLSAKEDVIRLTMQFTTWFRICVCLFF